MHKWESSKNGAFLEWNKLLASEMLPHCYKFFLTFVCENKLLKSNHYLLWPSISLTTNSIWSALLPFLIKSELFLSEKSNLVNISCAYLYPRNTDKDKIPGAVISVLEYCNKEILFLPSKYGMQLMIMTL